MALYSYQSLSKQGKKVSGYLDASSTQDAKQQILRMGLFIIKVMPAQDYSDTQPWYKKLFQGKVTLKDKILFTRQLSVLLKSGVPLLQALELLIDQFESKMRSILVTLKDGIKEGLSLADGLKKYPKEFDNIFVQLVRAGEATGKLEFILERLAEYLEKKEALQKKIKKALQYPLSQLFIIGIVVIFLLSFVVPKIADVFSGAGDRLPLPTRIMISLSDFVLNHYILLVLVVVVVVGVFLYWKSTEAGSRLWDKIKLRLPIVKFFAKTGAVVQFSKTLGMLLEGGVSLSEALDIVCNIVQNKVLSDQLKSAREKIIKEGKIAQFLKQTGMFPPIAIYLIRTGEESGELAHMLLTVGNNYEEELSDVADKLTARLEPIMMIVMALVVGFIVMSIAIPLANITEYAEKMG